MKKKSKWVFSGGLYWPTFHVDADKPIVTQQDVSWAVLHELDLFDEGQDTNVLTLSQSREARRFLKQYPPYDGYKGQ